MEERGRTLQSVIDQYRATVASDVPAILSNRLNNTLTL